MNKWIRLVLNGVGVIAAFTATQLSGRPVLAPQAATVQPIEKTIRIGTSVVNHPFGIVRNGTTYMPIWYVMQALKQLDITYNWNGRTWNLHTPAQWPIDLASIPVTHGTASILLDNVPVEHISSVVETDPSSHQSTTYMPIWYVQQLLHRVGITSDWNGTTWTLKRPAPIPVTVAGSDGEPALKPGTKSYPVVVLQQKLNFAGYRQGAISGSYDATTQVAVAKLEHAMGLPASTTVTSAVWTAVNRAVASKSAHLASAGLPSSVRTGPPIVQSWTNSQASLTDVQQHTAYTRINNDFYQISANGTVVTAWSDPANYFRTSVQTATQSHHQQVFATVSDYNGATGKFDGSTLTQVLASTSLRDRLINQLVVLSKEGYDGVELDFESVPASARGSLDRFLADLAGRLHTAGKQLAVDVPAESGSTAESWDGAFDYAAIGHVADWVTVMAYDFSYPQSAPGAIAPLYWDEQVLSYATSVIPAGKIILGMPAYGYDWNTTTGKAATALSLPKVTTLMAQEHATQHWDSTDAVPYFTYVDAHGDHHIVYYTNEASMERKLVLAEKFHVAGVAMWKAGLENGGTWQAILPWKNRVW